ncbi:retroviral-like aspartic protease family protein [Candidatus Hecatella orcuttiae]|uniref:retroviral-like aspartic protease family protein n=1 Tax=Candidatus Hecatella orcuttiae TaxID=1935119 RepID=UPI002867E31F|nr:retroviral-like aspartic protease family protein [Candidatus Hecatella orcuttiae]
MGITHLEGTVKGPAGEEQVRFLVDSSATYSLLPQKVWRKIGLKPMREHTFTLADGSAITRKVSECYIILPQGEARTPVILGEAGDEALLGVVTLEILGLVLDPFKRTLKPMRMLLV